MAGKANFKIETPRGRVISFRTKAGEFKSRLVWNEGFAPKKREDFTKAQEFVDSECLRYMNPLTPRLSGAMIKSASLGTVIGSGQIEYLSPYARRQYYENRGNGQRGRLWFERMKSQHRKAIMKGAAKIAGG